MTAAAAVLEKVTRRLDSSQSFQGGFEKATFKATVLFFCLILQPHSSRCSGVRSLRMQSTGGSDVGGLGNASLSDLELNEGDSLAISNVEVCGGTTCCCLFCRDKKTTLSK